MVKVKICGLTNRQDDALACELGADYAGFVFYERSPRFIDPAAARKLVRNGGYSAVRVGVFVNEEISRVKDIFAYVGLDLVQLHGDEDRSYCESLALPYWKVIRIKDAASVDQMLGFRSGTFLLDSYSEGLFGGTGRPTKRAFLQKAMESGNRIIIAGGVSVRNIEEIVRMEPFGVDVCSSLEERPGRKSARKMKEFFHKIDELRRSL